jgi:hypothetical protein
MHNRFVVIAAIASLFAHAACAGSADHRDAGGAFAPVTHDSAGITIVEVPGENLSSVPDWSVASEPAVSIGAVSGEAPYLFQRVSAARRLSNGEIMISDQSLELRMYGPDGVFRRSYGRRGGGPGEFGGYPIRISEPESARVAIYDEPRENVTFYNLLTGEYTTEKLTTECRAPGDAQESRCNVVSVLADGAIFASRTAAVANVAAEPPTAEPAGGQTRFTVGQLAGRAYGRLSDGAFHPFDTIAGGGNVRTAPGSDFFSAEALFNPGGRIALGTAGVISGDPLAFEIRVRSTDGALRRIIRVNAKPQVITADMLARHRSWADTALTNPIAKEYLASLRPGGRVPYFGALHIDRVGRIWIRNYQAPTWWGPRTPAVWTILDSTGVPLGRVNNLPRGNVLDIGDDYVLILQTDAEGVEFVRLFPLNARPERSF